MSSIPTTNGSSGQPTTRATLGLTGLTSNAMALIAPGAFLWLTFGPQVLTGAPGAGMAMFLGIIAALLLCLATAVAYAELSKLYPGAGSSYFFAEQSFLSKSKAYKWARVVKFMVGWASHLYYWVYPGVMVGVTALMVGYVLGQLWPNTFSAGYPSPIFMFGFSIIFSFGVAYIAYRGVGGTTTVNAVINIIQISALIVFSILAISHRLNHPEGSNAYVLDSTGTAVNYVQDTIPDTSKTIADPKNPGKQIQDPNATLPKVDADGNSVAVYVAADASGAILKGTDGNPIVIPTDKDGKLPTTMPATAAKAVTEPFTLSYQGGITKDDKGIETYNYHDSAKSVLAPHAFSYVIIQACVAILILVGFESVTSMGEEAKNAKRDIPRAVILSLLIQGGFCYLFEYFATNYYLHSGYGATANASSSSAPIGDIMQLVGAWAFGSPKAGWWFMMIQAFTVFLALIGTTLSCLSTGARVTYAMGRDEEVPAHFGMLHGKHASPHRAGLGPGDHLRDSGLPDRRHLLLRPGCHRWHQGCLQRHGQRPAGRGGWLQLLVQVRHPPPQLRNRLRHPAKPFDDHSREQFRHVPSLHDDLLHLDRGFPGTPHVPRIQARRGPGLRASGEPTVHGLLPRRPVLCQWHERQGALYCIGRGRGVGHLRSDLFRASEQDPRQARVGNFQTNCDAVIRRFQGRLRPDASPSLMRM